MSLEFGDLSFLQQLHHLVESVTKETVVCRLGINADITSLERNKPSDISTAQRSSIQYDITLYEITNKQSVKCCQYNLTAMSP